MGVGRGAGRGPGDTAQVTGVLSFGARHMSDESAHHGHGETTVRWKHVWVETKLSDDELAAAGVRPGSRVVPSSYRKKAIRIGGDGEYVASYAIDDKGSVAGLLGLAGRLTEPSCDVELVFTSREEIGTMGPPITRSAPRRAR